MNNFDLKRVVTRYMNLANALKDRTINEEELGERLGNDLRMFDDLNKSGKLSDNDLEAVLETVSSFEDIYIEIIKTQSNGQHG